MTNKLRLEAIRCLKPIPEAERSKYSIKDLKVGGYFSFRNQNWLVLSISRYLETKWEDFSPLKEKDWTYELTILSLKTGEKRYIEYYEDDDIEIYFTEKEVKLTELGLTRADLEEIADEEEGTINFDGKSFEYSDDETSAARYFRKEDDKEGIPVRLYEFEAGSASLTIEAWSDDANDVRPDREAYLSSEVSSSDIGILQLST